MRTIAVLSSLILSSAVLNSCQKCAECTYYEELNGQVITEIPYEGRYCGDEYRALEKKTYTVPGSADAIGYNKCVVVD